MVKGKLPKTRFKLESMHMCRIITRFLCVAGVWRLYLKIGNLEFYDHTVWLFICILAYTSCFIVTVLIIISLVLKCSTILITSDFKMNVNRSRSDGT